MFEAQILRSPGTGEEVSVYSPWFPRGGDNGTFTVDVVAMGSLDFTVALVTKNSEESGPGTLVTGASTTPTGVGRKEFTVASTASVGIKELVRYKYTVSEEATPGVASVLFRMLSPVWFDDVKA